MKKAKAGKKKSFDIVLVSGESLGAFRKLLTTEAADGFVSLRGVFCLGAVCDDTAVAALAAIPDGDTLRIISLYTAPSFRRCGAASALLDELEKLAEDEMGTVSIRFSVTDSETDTLRSFFEKRDYEEDRHNGKNIYMVPMSSVSDLTDDFNKRYKMDKRKPLGLASMDEFSEDYLSVINAEAADKKAPLPEGGIFGKGVDTEVSTILYRRGKLIGYCMIDDSVLGFPTIAAAWIERGHAVSMAHIFYQTLLKVKELRSEEHYLAMNAVTDSSATLVRKYLDGAMGISYKFYKTV